MTSSSRVARLASSIQFLITVEELFKRYIVYGRTRRGRYFEVLGVLPNTIKINVFDNTMSTTPISERRFSIERHDVSVFQKLAEELHTLIEKELQDEIREIGITKRGQL